jgi:hypothetical protein
MALRPNDAGLNIARSTKGHGAPLTGKLMRRLLKERYLTPA